MSLGKRDRRGGQAKRTVLSETVRNFRATTRRTLPPWPPCIAAGSVDRICRLLSLTVLGHTGAICITPVVVGEVAARL
jgi:hypothetical protein